MSISAPFRKNLSFFFFSGFFCTAFFFPEQPQRTELDASPIRRMFPCWGIIVLAHTAPVHSFLSSQMTAIPPRTPGGGGLRRGWGPGCCFRCFYHLEIPPGNEHR